MKTISISEIANEVRNGHHVIKLALEDASKYAANATGEMTWAASLVEKKYAYRHPGDEVVKVGNKEANISELVRILNDMRGKGNAIVWLGGNGEIKNFYGEVLD